MLPDFQSKQLGAEWVKAVNDRTDKTVPISHTEQKVLRSLGRVVEEAASHAAWSESKWDIAQQQGVTPPTTASSVPAIPELVSHRAAS